MWSAATYRPDSLVVAGSAWARRRGIPNHCVSTRRVGEHLHVVNHMFDHAEIAAAVLPGEPGYAAKVVPGKSCPVCDVPRFKLTFTSNGARQCYVGTWEQVCGRAPLVFHLDPDAVDVAVTDRHGHDVTFDVPAFAS